MVHTDSGSGPCDFINDVVKFSISNGHISGTDRPIDFAFDPRVGFSGTADRMNLLLVAPNTRWRLVPKIFLSPFDYVMIGRFWRRLPTSFENLAPGYYVDIHTVAL